MAAEFVSIFGDPVCELTGMRHRLFSLILLTQANGPFTREPVNSNSRVASIELSCSPCPPLNGNFHRCGFSLPRYQYPSRLCESGLQVNPRSNQADLPICRGFPPAEEITVKSSKLSEVLRTYPIHFPSGEKRGLVIEPPSCNSSSRRFPTPADIAPNAQTNSRQ